MEREETAGWKQEPFFRPEQNHISPEGPNHLKVLSVAYRYVDVGGKNAEHINRLKL